MAGRAGSHDQRCRGRGYGRNCTRWRRAGSWWARSCCGGLSSGSCRECGQRAPERGSVARCCHRPQQGQSARACHDRGSDRPTRGLHEEAGGGPFQGHGAQRSRVRRGAGLDEGAVRAARGEAPSDYVRGRPQTGQRAFGDQQLSHDWHAHHLGIDHAAAATSGFATATAGCAATTSGGSAAATADSRAAPSAACG